MSRFLSRSERFRLSLFGYDPKLDHAELTADEERGPRVNARDVDQSLALLKPTETLDHGGGKVLTPGAWPHQVLRSWIAAGAPYEAATAPYLSRLEVVPREIQFQPGEKIGLRTVAWFSDGTCEEVTPLTTWASNDDSVAQVSDDGVVTATGTGDTAIVVSFAGGVVTTDIFVPQSSAGDFPDYPPRNRADELVAAKLRKLGIHPSSLCSDEEFLRRVHVDLIGTLPTADEVRAFLDDSRSDKRERWIDSLLERPEYALYWATIFCDWLGNNESNFNTSTKMCNLVHSWLNEKLSRNVPYDELVGAIITATSREGRPLEEYLAENKAVYEKVQPRNGFDDGTYAKRKTLDLFWLRRMSDRDKALATRAASTFLGIQIQCAECHKHPFDRWTQDDFEGFASFFRVVQFTDLDGSPQSGNRLDYHTVALYPGPDRRFGRSVEQHPPKLLGGKVVPYEKDGSDPRIELWNWMCSPENPYFARNISNRLWGHYFGTGIVDPIDDQSAANPPSNPALLEWLAQDFIEHGFDLKHLHRRILNSRTYQLSHVPNESNRNDKRNFSHAMVRRMPAEVTLDAIAQVTGTRLVFNSYAAPPGTRAIALAVPSRYGRSEYFMSIFGRPQREQTCACERSNQPSLAQALFLINDDEIHTRIADPKGRLAILLDESTDDRQLVDELYLTCLARRPRPDELQKINRHIAQSSSRQEAMQDVMWSLLNVREFVFVK
jgi:hypothetical protein